MTNFSSSVNAVILAAGMGIRLKQHTKNKPKAMVEVNGKALIDYAIRFAENGGIKNIYVVSGFVAEMLSEHLQRNYLDIKLVVNKDYKLGNILSLAAVIEKINPPFLMMNVDHIYPDAIIRKLLKSEGDVVAAVDFDRMLGSDDMKVKLNEQKEIVAISKQLTDYDCGYIGITFVKEQGFLAYLNAFKEVLHKRGGSASVEEIIGNLALTRNKAKICDLSGLKWLEVDTEEELLKADETLKNDRGFFNRKWL